MNLDWITILIALISVFAGGVGVALVKGGFGRKGNVNQILRDTVKDLQAIHKEEIERLHELHKIELEKVHQSYREKMLVMEAKIDELRNIISRYEEQHACALEDIKKKLK